MTVTNGLCTRAQLEAYIGTLGHGPAPVSEPGAMDDAINTASRAIGQHCGREFYDSGAATARRFTVTDPYCLRVDDFSTTTGLVVKADYGNDGTYETTWASTDYELDPIDGVRNGSTGWPFERIYAVGSYTFPTPIHGQRRYTVQVTARWGWAAVPEPVRQACLQVASEVFRYKDAPFGIAQTVEFGPTQLSAGTVRRVSSLLETFRDASRAPGFGIA